MMLSNRRVIVPTKAYLSKLLWGRRLSFASSSSSSSVGHSQQRRQVEVIDTDEDFGLFFSKQIPVVLRNYASSSSPIAVSQWKDLDYLVNRAVTYEETAAGADSSGIITCNVEVGGSYNNREGNEAQHLTIPFESYVNDYLRLAIQQRKEDVSQESLPSDQILYLAQNDLNAFGKLAQDVNIPRMCDSLGHGHFYQTMLWMGPQGAFSPLHYDPLDNILMQMVGTKNVALLPRQVDQSALYVGEEYGQQYNTSATDNILSPSLLDKYPLFRAVQDHVLTAKITPGDCLYIPAKWWHQVESKTWSISVNVWWR